MSEIQDLFEEWFQPVLVWKRTGTNAQGDVYPADGVSVDVMVEEKRRAVLNTDGTSRVSEATLYLAPEDLAKFNDKTKVQLPSGRVAFVVAIAHPTAGPDLPEHGVVNTT